MIKSRNLSGLRADEAVRQLNREGYSIQFPAELGEEVLRTDRKAARRVICPTCRERAISYLPFVSVFGSYRGLSVCRCGRVEEI